MIAHQNPTPRKPERVVLLGARGFIGAAIRGQLKGHGIPNLALTSSDLNLSDASAGEKLAAMLTPSDAVVMLAALTPDKGRDIATMMKNFAMMQTVCAAVGKIGCGHFVYFSSDAVYNGADSRVTEETPASPQDLYGATHYTREIMARSLAKIPVLVLRPTLIYGLDDTHNSYGPNRFRRAAQKDGKPEMVAPLLADRFVNTDTDGKVSGKEALLASLKGGRWEQNGISDVKVIAFGHVAIATGAWTGKGVDGDGSKVDRRER